MDGSTAIARTALRRLGPVALTALVTAAFVAPSLAVPVLSSGLATGTLAEVPGGVPSSVAPAVTTSASGPTPARGVTLTAENSFRLRDGHPRTSTSRGAWLRWAVAATPGTIVALVATVGPDHGRLQVSLDGVVLDVVDTQRARPATTVVWRRSLPPGPHTVTVANLGTLGRAVLGVEALILL